MIKARSNSRLSLTPLLHQAPGMPIYRCITLLLVLSVETLLGTSSSQAQANGQPGVPFLGWGSWSQQSQSGYLQQSLSYNNWLTASKIESESTQLAKTGLDALGYKNINMDSGWSSGYNLSNGLPVANASNFPGGVQVVATFVHGTVNKNGAKVQKLGIYYLPGVPLAVCQSSAITVDPTNNASYPINGICATQTVNNVTTFLPGNALPYDDGTNAKGLPSWVKIDFTKPGAQVYVNSVVSQFVSWGIDYIKLDFVMPGSEQGTKVDNTPDIAAWSQAIKTYNHAVWLDLSNSIAESALRNWQATSNSWRIDGDIECYCSNTVNNVTTATVTSWGNVASRFNDLVAWQYASGPKYGWNNLDSLDVGYSPIPVPGQYSGSIADGLTQDERKSMMTLWAIANAPIEIGDDLNYLDSYGIGLLSNANVIAVDQSQSPGLQMTGGTTPVWASPALSDGSYNVALFNLGSASSSATINWSDLGFSGSANVVDLWSGASLGPQTGSYTATLNSHASALVRVTPSIAPSSPVTFGHRYLIVSKNSGQVIDDNNFSAISGQPQEQYPANGGTNQQWVARANGSSWTFTNASSGLVLEVPTTPAPQENTVVDQAAYNSNNSTNSYQKWNLIRAGDGSYEIQSVGNTAWGLDVRGGSTAAQAPIIVWPYNNQANQHWTFQLVQ